MSSKGWIAIWVLLATASLATAGEPEPWFPALDNEAAWACLPETVSGTRGEVLPMWARVLVRTLPSTTAAMLELDHVQRVENPLDPLLRAKIRWIAAQANGCKYAAACAQADLVRAGGNADDLQQIVDSPERLPDWEKRLFAFARKMCLAAYEVSDAEVEQLLAEHGPERLAAIVLTIAYSNFQDRVLIALGVESDNGEWLPPPNVKFDWDSLKEHPLKVPERVAPESTEGLAAVPTEVSDLEWHAAPLNDLQKRLQKQQLRTPRIPIPPDDVVERQTPPGMYPPGSAAKIRWNSVTYGYQPQLTHAWFFAMRRWREEAKLPDDFRQSAFWVVTRSNMCFY
jgi:alkylhydroperoxidase family enzyme